MPFLIRKLWGLWNIVFPKSFMFELSWWCHLGGRTHRRAVRWDTIMFNGCKRCCWSGRKRERKIKHPQTAHLFTSFWQFHAGIWMSVWRCNQVYLPSICSPCLVGHGDGYRWDLWQPCWLLVLFLPLSLSVALTLSLSPSVSHFNAELIQSGWAVQEQPSGSALLLHARQEVARTAACNSTWDFVWVTYIMAQFTFYCNFKAAVPLSLSFPFAWFQAYLSYTAEIPTQTEVFYQIDMKQGRKQSVLMPKKKEKKRANSLA